MAIIILGIPRLYRQLGSHPYGLLDIYYYRNILREHNPNVQAWTNCDPIYVAMNWKLPWSYLDQIEWTDKIIPWEKLNTVAFFDIHDHLLYPQFKGRKGWILFQVPLKRGFYKWLYLLKRQ